MLINQLHPAPGSLQSRNSFPVQRKEQWHVPHPQSRQTYLPVSKETLTVTSDEVGSWRIHGCNPASAELHQEKVFKKTLNSIWRSSVFKDASPSNGKNKVQVNVLSGWVMQSAYNLSAGQICNAFTSMANSPLQWAEWSVLYSRNQYNTGYS